MWGKKEMGNCEELQWIDDIFPPPELQLLEYVKANNSAKIKSFVSENPDSLHTVIGHPYDKPILYIACCELANEIRSETIETLIQLGASLHHTDATHKDMEAIHFAVLGSNPKVLEVILRHLKQEEINTVTSNNNTALNLIVKEGEVYNMHGNLVECVQMLVLKGINVNLSFPPILHLLHESRENVDVESHKLRDKSTRGYMKELQRSDAFTTSNNNETEPLLEEVIIHDNNKNRLFQLLKKGDENVNNECAVCSVNLDDRLRTTCIALLDGLKTIIPESKVKHVDNEIINNLFYKMLLENKENINGTDLFGDTALQYAARYGDASETLELLRTGASMASTNKRGTLFIEDIDCDTLQTHLNECMEINLNSNTNKQNVTVTFNYKTLMPQSLHSTDECNDDTETDARPFISQPISTFSSETKVILYISKSPELKHLLMHPTISSFLYMKWHRFRWFFYINLTIHISFCLSLLLYIFLPNEYETISQNSTFAFTGRIFHHITTRVIMIRMLISVLVSHSSVAVDFESYTEIALILASALVWRHSNPQDTSKQASAIAILLAALKLVLLISEHPKMSTNIVVFRKVTANFFKFLLWHSILIIAFSLSFYILFKDGPQQGKKDSEKGEEVNFFINPGLSLFKTIVMLTGEFDISSINFNIYPVTSRIIFMLFVFMIAIVLFNLLNGLAVNDTEVIKSKAELGGHIERIQYIANMETMLLANCMPKMLKGMVCLFPHFLHDYKLVVYPNQYAKVSLPTDVYSDSESETFFTRCTSIYLDRQTAKRIKDTIKERKEDVKAEKSNNSTVQMQNDISEQQKCIEELRKDRQLILRKLDSINGQLGVAGLTSLTS